MSDHGVTLEQIADLVGHSGTRTTETVYRHQLKPVLWAGAGIMDSIFADEQLGNASTGSDSKPMEPEE